MTQKLLPFLMSERLLTGAGFKSLINRFDPNR